MKEYRLLKHHMNANPDYLFGHAEVAGLLATNDDKVKTFGGYTLECGKRGISSFNEECYNQFMIDCNRPLITFGKGFTSEDVASGKVFFS